MADQGDATAITILHNSLLADIPQATLPIAPGGPAITTLHNSLLADIPQATLPIDTRFCGPPTIFRVPDVLRLRDRAAYIPKLVAIGPYHRHNEKINEMHSVKLRYLGDLMQRAATTEKGRDFLGKCLEIIYRRVDEAKVQYQDATSLNLNGEEFVKMLVVDGCFIIEFLIKWYLGDRKTQVNAVKAKLNELRTDLLLVENQVPFFVLEELFKAADITSPELDEDTGLVELALVYLSGDRFRSQLGTEEYRRSELFKSKKITHLLHLYHVMCLEPAFIKGLNDRSTKVQFEKQIFSSCLLFFIVLIRGLVLLSLRPVLWALGWLLSKIWYFVCKTTGLFIWILYLLVSNSGLVRHITGGRGRQNFSGIPNARYLRDTGFKFEKKEPLSCFSYVTHKGRTIKIPELSVHWTTLPLLKNLIAFEQCPFWDGNCFTAFATFMDYLVDTAEDVAVLRHHGIIDKRLGDDEMLAGFFNGLCKDVYFDDEHQYLRRVFGYVTGFYAENYTLVKFCQWRNKLIPDYFSNPWAVPSMIAAFIALVLSVTSTFYTIYPYYHPRS